MQKPALPIQRCVQHLVILGWLASLGAQANAQKGVIVIQGEITAPTCVVKHFNILPLRQSSTDERHACVGYIEPLSAIGISETTRVKEHTLANEAIDKRIRTVTYR